MADLVDPDKIEAIVGVNRSPDIHWGRFVSEMNTVFILHSGACLDRTVDLRMCRYSKALDLGLRNKDWKGREDKPVMLSILFGRLIPIMMRKSKIVRRQDG